MLPSRFFRGGVRRVTLGPRTALPARSRRFNRPNIRLEKLEDEDYGCSRQEQSGLQRVRYVPQRTIEADRSRKNTKINGNNQTLNLPQLVV
jgi:hypothetical protein